MLNFKIIVQYDGTRYKGWQRQKSADNTIEGKLETLLERQLGVPVEVFGSGRTDAGVHALAQTASFHAPDGCIPGTGGEEKCRAVKQMFDDYLPEDIAVTDVRLASDRFHARLNAKGKKYVYRIWTASHPNVFERKYMAHMTAPLDIETMRAAAAYLTGQHDFAAFCGNARMKKSTIRFVRSINIERIDNEVRFTYTGSGFLQYMVRILTGTLVQVGRGEFPPEHVIEVLESKDRVQAGPTMPAKGLTLVEVYY